MHILHSHSRHVQKWPNISSSSPWNSSSASSPTSQPQLLSTSGATMRPAQKALSNCWT
jgi:hypothetical protein